VDYDELEGHNQSDESNDSFTEGETYENEVKVNKIR